MTNDTQEDPGLKQTVLTHRDQGDALASVVSGNALGTGIKTALAVHFEEVTVVTVL